METIRLDGLDEAINDFEPLMHTDRTLIVANAICDSVFISVLLASISGSTQKQQDHRRASFRFSVFSFQ